MPVKKQYAEYLAIGLMAVCGQGCVMKREVVVEKVSRRPAVEVRVFEACLGENTFEQPLISSVPCTKPGRLLMRHLLTTPASATKATVFWRHMAAWALNQQCRRAAYWPYYKYKQEIQTWVYEQALPDISRVPGENPFCMDMLVLSAEVLSQ
jgi:hypothetical protein